jgi:rubrerythrin
MIPMTTLKELSDTILALDPDYWKCDKCGAINSTQKDGDVCPWCNA